jgi:hypothetical protein
LGIRGGEDAVEEEFGGGEASSFSTDIARVIDEITTNSPPNTARLVFLGTIGNYIAQVGCTSALGELDVSNEVDCVRAFGLFVPLGEPPSFLSTGQFPEEACTMPKGRPL